MLEDDGTKWLTASRLIELLATLPPNSRVSPNAVGNLLVLTEDGSDCISYVNFMFDGEVVEL